MQAFGYCCCCNQHLSYENHGDGPPEGYICDNCGRWVCKEHVVLIGILGPVYCPDCANKLGERSDP